MLKYKIIMAGAKGVGKSSLITRYCDKTFDENMKRTIGVAFKRKTIELEDNLRIEINIWDFAGEEQFRKLFPPYVQGATAALILYDTTKRETLDDIINWVNLIDSYCRKDILKKIIGTKIDLKDQRQILKEKAEKVCANYNFYGEIIETSSKTGENVEETFLEVAREIVNSEFQKCRGCGGYYSKKLKICSNCGEPRY